MRKQTSGTGKLLVNKLKTNFGVYMYICEGAILGSGGGCVVVHLIQIGMLNASTELSEHNWV